MQISNQNKFTKSQINAIKKIPPFVNLEELSEEFDGGIWSHVIFRVEHPIHIFEEGEEKYTKKQANDCKKWLKKYANI